jgi:putative tryptophan/tyrosine transport system substrate-binding protein
MRKRAFLVSAAGSALGLPQLQGLAFAQPARPRVARVGWLGWSGDTSAQPSLALAALREGLAAAGWREGDNLQLEVRNGDREQGAALTTELVRAGVEVIAAQGPMALFARGPAGTVPIVFSINGDPVQAGLVESLPRPGGLLTGISALNDELSAKRVDLLKAARPAAQRVAVIANNRHPGLGIELEATAGAMRRLGLVQRYFPIQQPKDLDSALAAIAAEPFDALLAFPDTLINRLARPLAEFNTRHRLPSMSGWAEYAEAGNLLSYGPVYHDFFRHQAALVDKLLRGARAADLPVERPTRFEFVVNRGAALAMGLVLPPQVLLRADKVIG